MSRQDKATTEKHARSLRELVKKPENKVCADCKRNDPRWASWNLGVFLCIRCSGIHRGMGTHISKVKSVDLDVWTPEQMESIQKWGNRRANLYWEAHLKSGHIPPEHKIESFIRSKYESRRWATDGPPPTDPSILEQAGDRQNVQDSQRAPASTSHAGPSGVTTGIATIDRSALPTAARQPPKHQLLSANFADPISNNEAASASQGSLKNPAAEVKVPAQESGDLFSLDFHVPPVSMTRNGANSEQPRKDVKEEILSLFSASNTAPTTTSGFSATSTHPSASSIAETQQSTTSMMGTNGVGVWGTGSGWTGPMATQQSSWGNLGTAPPPPSRLSLFNTSDVWQTPSSSQNQQQSLNTATTSTVQHITKKDDVFGDLWG